MPQRGHCRDRKSSVEAKGGITLTKNPEFYQQILRGHNNKQCKIEIPRDQHLSSFALTGAGAKNGAHPLAVALALTQLVTASGQHTTLQGTLGFTDDIQTSDHSFSQNSQHSYARQKSDRASLVCHGPSLYSVSSTRGSGPYTRVDLVKWISQSRQAFSTRGHCTRFQKSCPPICIPTEFLLPSERTRIS